MAYNQDLAQSLRTQINKSFKNIEEKKMFGGLCFMYRDKMSVGIVKNDLMVRVIGSKIQEELAKPNVRPMDFTKRPMKEFIFVKVAPEDDLSHWIQLGIEHATLKSEL